MHWPIVIMSVLFLPAAVILADVALYPVLIAQTLPGGQDAPLVMWTLVGLPIPTVAILIGMFLRGREVLVVGGAAGVLIQLYGWLAARLHWPGHAKSYAIEAPTMFWTAGLVLVIIVATVLLAIGSAARRLIK